MLVKFAIAARFVLTGRKTLSSVFCLPLLPCASCWFQRESVLAGREGRAHRFRPPSAWCPEEQSEKLLGGQRGRDGDTQMSEDQE